MPDETPDSALAGGCLCGAVRLEAHPDKREGYYCHCRMCQLAVGNTRAAFINLLKSQVTWTRGAPTPYASSKLAVRGFCNRCGTPLTFAYNESQRMDLSVGSFDEPAALTPVSHFAVESRVENWHADDGLPGERLDASTGLMDRWKTNYGSEVVPGVAATRKA
jgi:hypothetical protein